MMILTMETILKVPRNGWCRWRLAATREEDKKCMLWCGGRSTADIISFIYVSLILYYIDSLTIWQALTVSSNISYQPQLFGFVSSLVFSARNQGCEVAHADCWSCDRVSVIPAQWLSDNHNHNLTTTSANSCPHVYQDYWSMLGQPLEDFDFSVSVFLPCSALLVLHWQSHLQIHNILMIQRAHRFSQWHSSDIIL
jgi:hypothetical protein